MRIVRHPGDDDGFDVEMVARVRDGRSVVDFVPRNGGAPPAHSAMTFLCDMGAGFSPASLELGIYMLNMYVQKFVCAGFFIDEQAGQLREENERLADRVAELEALANEKSSSSAKGGNGALTAEVAALAKDGLSERQIAGRLGVGKGTVGRHKAKAEEAGLLQ